MSDRLTPALETLTWAALVGLPLALVYQAASGALGPEAVGASFSGLPGIDTIGSGRAALVLIAGLLPWPAVLIALWHIRALLALYRGGHALTEAAAERIRRIGLALVAAAFLGTAAHTLQILIATAANPAGERVLSFQIGSGGVGFLLAGGLLFVIGRAMSEAARAVEDNRSIV